MRTKAEYQQILQNLFDTSLNHIRKQGGPSKAMLPSRTDPEKIVESCVYKSPDSKGCAAAPFIKEYDPAMEKKTWANVVESFPDKVEPLAVEFEEFVTSLQECHDDAAVYSETVGFLPVYEKRMAELAERYDLTYQEP